MKTFNLVMLLILPITTCCAQNASDVTGQRLRNIKNSTVQILIDNVVSGTGFYINANGLVATNMHVVESENLKLDSLKRVISKIEIVTNSKERHEVLIPKYFTQGEGYLTGKFYDFICLEPKQKGIKTPFLKSGNFSDVKEGDNIYTCGYPFGIAEPVYTTGLLSTKFKQFSTDSIASRNVAWLDLSMNKGNSGGAIMVMKENPNDDYVVGIASFNLNILSSYANRLKAIARNQGANAIIGGLDIKGFAELTAVSIESNSYGIGGMISIEHLKSVLK